MIGQINRRDFFRKSGAGGFVLALCSCQQAQFPANDLEKLVREKPIGSYGPIDPLNNKRYIAVTEESANDGSLDKTLAIIIPNTVDGPYFAKVTLSTYQSYLRMGGVDDASYYNMTFVDGNMEDFEAFGASGFPRFGQPHRGKNQESERDKAQKQVYVSVYFIDVKGNFNGIKDSGTIARDILKDLLKNLNNYLLK